MSTKYKFKDDEKIYFVSFAVVDWIDIFVRTEYRDIFTDSLKYCIQHKDLQLFAWCLMTSHVHLIIGTTGNSLSNIMRDLKKHTAKKLYREISIHPIESRREWLLKMMREAGKLNSNNDAFQFWQQDNHPIELASPLMIQQKLDYLHNNPVMAGFVEKPED